MDFDKESKKKLLSLISAGNFIIYDIRVEISLMPINGKFFDFKKNSMQILWIVSCHKCIFARLWVKVFVSQGCVHAEITVHTL